MFYQSMQPLAFVSCWLCIPWLGEFLYRNLFQPGKSQRIINLLLLTGERQSNIEGEVKCLKDQFTEAGKDIDFMKE